MKNLISILIFSAMSNYSFGAEVCGTYNLSTSTTNLRAILEIKNGISASPQMLSGNIKILTPEGRLQNYQINESNMVDAMGRSYFNLKLIDPFNRYLAKASGVVTSSGQLELIVDGDALKRQTFRGQRINSGLCASMKRAQPARPGSVDECVLRCSRMPNAWECIRNC